MVVSAVIGMNENRQQSSSGITGGGDKDPVFSASSHCILLQSCVFWECVCVVSTLKKSAINFNICYDPCKTRYDPKPCNMIDSSDFLSLCRWKCHDLFTIMFPSSRVLPICPLPMIQAVSFCINPQTAARSSTGPLATIWMRCSGQEVTPTPK